MFAPAKRKQPAGLTKRDYIINESFSGVEKNSNVSFENKPSFMVLVQILETVMGIQNLIVIEYNYFDEFKTIIANNCNNNCSEERSI